VNRDSLEDVAEVFKSAPEPLFVIGSAISYAPPSDAPSAYEVMASTVKELAEFGGIRPTDCSSYLAAELTRPTWDILPESLYGAIAEAFPPGIHETVWGSLADLTDPSVGPNRCHLLVALVAFRSKGAILTTNFDPFLERAFEELNLNVETVTGREIWMGEVNSLSPQKVTILKIHGDASHPSTIVSKAPDLARSERVLGMSGLAGRHRTAIIIGYSGRDLDVFPWLVAESGVEKFYWIDTKFPPEHRSNEIDGCVRIQMGSEELATEVLQMWRERGDSQAVHILGRTTASAGDSLTELVATTAIRCVDNLDRTRPAAAVWTLGRVYADIGRHPLAAELLSMAPPPSPPDLVELQLLDSFVASSRDRYRDSQAMAREALRSTEWVADRRRRNGFKTRAALQSAYAYVLRHNLKIALPKSVPISDSPRPHLKLSAHKVLSRMRYVIALAVATPHGVRAIWASSDATFGATTDEFRVASDYLESLIRMQAFVGSILPDFLHQRILRRIDKLSHQAGYLTGALNCAKYLRRVPGGSKDMRIRGRLAVLNDQVAAAIELRDRAMESTEELVRLSPELLDAARAAGLPSVMLQLAVARRNANVSPLVKPDEVRALVASIQADQVEAISHELVASLVDESS
jgi:SIR2-like protein